ncbi:hypothetical protein G7Y79_00015g038920 [Physcia stellaris]|nr:hypothetical protein G7Y79_00015g038920 [Physcia stellaris]
MRHEAPGSNGPASTKPFRESEAAKQITSGPFRRSIDLADIAGPTYVTAQTVIQQVSYALSDRLWTYSFESFDLNELVKQWSQEESRNAYGSVTQVESLQIRHGAASIALGYMFSPDFDMKKRYIPQSVLATSSSLQYLRTSLDQLSLLYSVASPFVAHVAAVDYAAKSSRLVTDYVSAMTLVEEIGFGMLASLSGLESQHMALLATLLASIVPTIHIYDGVGVGRETMRLIDTLDCEAIQRTYKAVLQQTSSPSRRKSTLDEMVERTLDAMNSELGTVYKAFEYFGHPAPEIVLVVFGTVESSLGSQIASSLAGSGVQIGLVAVRIYRPFIESEFIRAIPESVRSIGVLGQVHDSYAVSDISVHSNLYGDVIAAITFSDELATRPAVTDIKYPRETVWTPISLAAAFQLLAPKPLFVGSQEQTELQLLDTSGVQQYTFWDVDDSPAAEASLLMGQALAKDSANNVTVSKWHDNLVEGGVFRTDIRKSKKTVEAAYSIESADMVVVGDPSILKCFDVTNGLKSKGRLLLKYAGVKDDQLEGKLSEPFKKALAIKEIQLFILDPSAIEDTANNPSMESILLQVAFLRVGLSNLEKIGLQKLASINPPSELDDALREIEIPKEWATLEIGGDASNLPTNIQINSFTSFDKVETEPPTYLRDWQTAAKGMAFKEAYGTKPSLRPDVSVQTYTVRVQENRRLTPPSYERNIFHIEFDLGDSGMKYDIGEALGVHAENDEVEVREFIKFYRLDPEEVVEVPTRENPNVLENRTVYQSLMQNIDIFGRPPKRFYEALADFADDANEAKELRALGGSEGAVEFKRRAEVDTITYADILLEFPSAHPSFHDIVRIVNPMKRREYSIASCQKVTPNSVALMIVVVGWVDPKGRDRFGQATRFLNKLKVGAEVIVSVKPSVMKLPPNSTQPLIMAGLGTGLAPFRAFVQHRAWEKQQGKEIGSVLLYMGSRHQREEYCYGEEWEAYQDAGVITLLGRAFSRDQPQKIYIQDRMRQTMSDIIQAYLKEDGAFYLCGPTWPVPDVTNVLEDAIARNAKIIGRKVDPRKEIDRLKEESRYVLEVY